MDREENVGCIEHWGLVMISAKPNLIALVAGKDLPEFHEVIYSLSSLNVEIEQIDDLSRAIDRLRTGIYSLVVLVDGVPRNGALEFCQTVRRHFENVPLVLLLKNAQPTEKILAFEFGADECLSLPLSHLEFRARIRSLFRRCLPVTRPEPQVIQSSLTIGELELDLDTKEVRHCGRPLSLTPTEYHLLRFLMSNSPKTLSQSELAYELWGFDSEVYERNIKWHVSRLRKKLSKNPAVEQPIVTVRGMGYRLASAVKHSQQGF